MKIPNNIPMPPPTDQEFLEHLMSEIVIYLYQKYGKRELPQAFSAHMNFYSQYRQSVEEINKRKIRVSTYTPQGKAEKAFHQKLMKTLAKST